MTNSFTEAEHFSGFAGSRFLARGFGRVASQAVRYLLLDKKKSVLERRNRMRLCQ
jgi:hypothetical protein